MWFYYNGVTRKLLTWYLNGEKQSDSTIINGKVEDINTYKIVEKAAPIDYGFAKGRKVKESVRVGTRHKQM